MQVAQADQLVGKKLGAYQVEHLLGHGQLSAVYLARHGNQDQAVLLTIFRYPEAISAQERKQFSSNFAREAANLLHLQHPNILPTRDFGEQVGHPYLATAYAKGSSLAQLLKQQTRLTPQQTLGILRQMADGLDYAHSNNVTHGNLSLSNVLVSSNLEVQIAGFGLRNILEAHRDRQSPHPQAHLLSETGIFLGSPDYIAPERVRGLSTGASADIYALGVMLYELLSGAAPFHNATSLETALQRIQQPAPLLHAACPDLSEGFDLVIGKALALDPARRYQQAGEVARAYERILQTLEVAQTVSYPAQTIPPIKSASDKQVTLLTAVDAPLEEEAHPTGKWQLMPPIVTGQLSAISPTSLKNTEPRQEIHAHQKAPIFAPQPDIVAEQAPHPRRDRQIGDSLVGTDPFAWWTNTTEQASPREPGTFARNARRSPVRLTGARGPRQAVRQDRRQVVKLITTGAVVAGIFAAGGISFARFAQSVKQANQVSSIPSPASTTTTRGNTPTTGTTQAAHPSPTTTKTPAPKPSPTHAAQPTPTAQPTQQPTPTPTQPPPPSPTPSPTPGHTGTVIGHTNMPTNSSVTFTNPADGQDSLLIHLQNGNFVACERACTHAGVPVNYNGGQKQIVCPAHGAIFDPLNGFAHLSGPGNGPLATVNIRVNGDGTITTG